MNPHSESKPDLAKVFDYHRATKHSFHGYARGPGYLEWATQPDPFRRYQDAQLIPLEKIRPADEPLYDEAFVPGVLPASPVNLQSVSQLFYDSLALSAWKSVGDSQWALRVNPSSGNLHPTEGYLICGPIENLCDTPIVGHYAPKEHGLEIRAQFPRELWDLLRAGFPEHVLFVGLASIHWREAWKYGERAFRYCQHDVGHAIGAIATSASGMGWRAKVLEGLSTDDLGLLLGTSREGVGEPEEPDTLLAVSAEAMEPTELPGDCVRRFETLDWHGRANQLSTSHADWGMEEIAAAVRKGHGAPRYEPAPSPSQPYSLSVRPVPLRQVISQRRSAVAMDAQTHIPRDTFYRILQRTLAVPGNAPFSSLPWKPHVHLAIFVHRVDDLPSGLYFLVRDPAQKLALETAITRADPWRRPDGCPEQMELYLLNEGDVRNTARQISCTQEIASDGCFSLGMIADFEQSLNTYGPWFYPRLFWEAGAIGQVLYLEAEAAGIRSTGIGCYFDDPMHEVLGLKDEKYQDLYHFTVGGPVEDTRLTTLPPYPEQ